MQQAAGDRTSLSESSPSELDPGIVLADASDFFRLALRDLLVADGHRCTAVAELTEAADALDDPDLAVVIFDLASGGDTALSIWSALHAERPTVRAIVLSTHADQDRVLEALRAGASDYLAKPLHEEELRLSLDRALAGHRADRELDRLCRLKGVAAGPRPGDEATGPDETDADLDLAREICEAVSNEGDPERVLARLLDVLAERLGALAVALYLRDATTGAFERAAQWETGPGRDRSHLPDGRGLTGAAIATGGFVSTEDPAGDPRFDGAVDTLAEWPPAHADGGLCIVPLRFRGSTVGLVRAFLPPGEAPSLRTAEIAGAALSAALRSVLLYRSWRASIDEVARIRRERVGRLSEPGAWTSPR
jgi:DNA-binding response OmpR family regulator